MFSRLLISLLCLAFLVTSSLGDTFSTPNFAVRASSPEVARTCAGTAEKLRRDLAVEWFGKPMPNWSKPCRISVVVDSSLLPGGSTTFFFDDGEVFGWQMSVQGPLGQVLGSVLPHEIIHTLFASHFRCPVPRWADEGAATSVEPPAEQTKYQEQLRKILKKREAMTFDKLFSYEEYPGDIILFLMQSHSVADYLIQSYGKRSFVGFVDTAMKTDNWPGALLEHYGIQSNANLQADWEDWVEDACPNRDTLDSEAAPSVLSARSVQPRIIKRAGLKLRRLLRKSN